jgi:hypothetical protein
MIGKEFVRQNVRYIFKDPNNKCIDFPIGEHVADGSSGSVFTTCVTHDCSYVIKLVPIDVFIPTFDCHLDDPETLRDCMDVTRHQFQKEIEMTKMFSDANVGPKLIAAGICDSAVDNEYQNNVTIGFIVQEKWDTSLKEYIQDFKREFMSDRDQIKELILKKARMLDQMGYRHIDLHEGNILVRLQGNKIYDIVLADFGDILRNDDRDDFTVQAGLRIFSRFERQKRKHRKLNTLDKSFI